ncbi:helix-turn-helix transcriptional regulator [Vibrio fluvialis]|nr:helix-turn-helix transcriptional regulator [Vibrio fluvialis]
MSKRQNPCCGVARFLTLMDGPWATLIIRELLEGSMRFTELRKALPGISAHTLTHRLKQFESNDLVTRTAYAETPPRVVYELTPLGESLRPVLEAMRVWGDSLPEQRLESSEISQNVPSLHSDHTMICPLSTK